MGVMVGVAVGEAVGDSEALGEAVAVGRGVGACEGVEVGSTKTVAVAVGGSAWAFEAKLHASPANRATTRVRLAYKLA